jgi:hypothetical protein
VAYCQERDEGFRVGLEFWNISADKKKMIGEFVEGYSRGVPVTCSVVEHSETEKSDDNRDEGGDGKEGDEPGANVSGDTSGRKEEETTADAAEGKSIGKGKGGRKRKGRK